MTAWTEDRMLAFDLESTGVDPDNDRIATACAAIVTPDAVVHQRDWIVAIDVEMPEAAAAVNKLTTDWLRANGQPPAIVIPEIARALRFAVNAGMPIVAYNAAFDVTFLDRELRRWTGVGLETTIGAPVEPVIDPFVIWKQVERFRKGGRTLTVACEAFGVQLGEKAHEAAADALAAVGLARTMGRRFRQIGGLDLERLHLEQIAWRARQCDELRDYFNRKGQVHDGVDGSWPLRAWEPQGALL